MSLPKELKIVQKTIESLLKRGTVKMHLKSGLLCAACNTPVTQTFENNHLIVKCPHCKKQWQ